MNKNKNRFCSWNEEGQVEGWNHGDQKLEQEWILL